MKVKELIKTLEAFNPELEVIAPRAYEDGYWFLLDVRTLEVSGGIVYCDLVTDDESYLNRVNIR